MIRSLDCLKSTPEKRHTLAVAVAQDAEVLSAVEAARKCGLADAILVGDVAAIRQVADECNISLEPYTLVQAEDKVDACRQAVTFVRKGEADVLMKGLVDTSVVLKQVLNAEYGLRTGRTLSHVAVFEVPNFDRLLLLTDAAMNIAPDVEAKKQIILNATDVAHALGEPDPIVACVCAVEKLNPKMPPTVDADELSKAGLPGCQVVGPLALDNAISTQAAAHKGITDPRAGHANILLMPDIEAGNIMYKSLVFLAGAKNAGIIVGARAPIVLTSRADSDETKLNSIALALYVAANTPKER
ncbi:MAG: phosphate butyryltransferase [Oscillospiraceae bacterium]|jgi:phosphate butyryltransferase|nr:phosphate butyryltransferase [Oscillospiraceae bacterium]